MEFKYFPILLILFAAHVTLALAHPSIEKRSLKPPSQGPFYNYPNDYAQFLPGTILRHRRAPAPLAKYHGQPSNVKTTYQVLYRSTDSNKHPEVAVTTLIVPDNADFTKLLSYQVYYDSANNDCSPSYQFLQGATANTTGALDSLAEIGKALSKGWIVNVPDYEGRDAAWSAGFQAGYATLDSVRAALQSGPITGVMPNATYAMWGYSGGSFASNWAAELQPSYAPELSFAGTAVGGLTPNFTSVFLTINEQPAAGLAVTSILGLAKQYSNLSAYLDTHLVESKASTFRMGERECFEQVGAQFANQNLFHYFKNGEAFLYDAVPSSITNHALILGKHGPPQMPLYFYKAVLDEISPIADTDALVRQYCAQGVDVQYVRNHVGNHEKEGAEGSAGAFRFLELAMSGALKEKGCSVTNVSIPD